MRATSNLPPGPTNDVILKGHALIVDTATHIGKSAADPQKRYAGNDLACVNCHLDAGLRPFGAPFVSTYASFPMMVDDKVITLKERINGCMIRSMNGKELPADGPEMQAIIAYIKYLGQATPEGVRVAGMGLFPIADPPLAADATRGQKVYADLCASCHKDDGQGEPNKSPRLGYLIPPLWGDDSFNAAAGMAKLAHAAAFVHGEPTKEKGGRGAERPRAIRFRPTSLDKGSMQTIEDGNEGDCRAGEYEIGEKVGMAMTRSYRRTIDDH
jgi:thiosulfate dehydrogenase